MKHLILLCFALLVRCTPAYAAFTEFYVQTTGSNLNSGTTTSDASTLTYASGNWVASTGVFTVASGAPSSDGVTVGDFASVYANGASATGFVGRITARDATTITVSLSAIHGTAPADGTSNRTLKIGGAWDGPSGSVGFPFGVVKAAGVNVSSDPVRVNFKTGVTYTVASAMTHGNTGPLFFESYQTTPGDHGAQAIIDGGATGAVYSILTVSSGASNISFDGFTFQNNGNSGSGGTEMVDNQEAGNIWKRCSFKNAWGSGFNTSSLDEMVLYECEATNCRLQGGNGSNVGALVVTFSGSLALRCFSHDNVLDGYSTDGGVLISHCISSNNGFSGAGSTGDENLFVVGFESYANGDNGYSLGDGSQDQMNCIFLNSNFIDNTGYGLRVNTQPTPGMFLGIGNGTGTASNSLGLLQFDKWWTAINTVAYGSNLTPYTAPGTNDFRVTLDAAEHTGYGFFTQVHPSYTGTIAYPAIGAAQQ